MRLFLVSMSLGVAVLSLNGCFTISDDDSTAGGAKSGSGGATQSAGNGGSTAGSATNASGGMGGSAAGTAGMGGRIGRAGDSGFLPGKGGTGSGGDQSMIGGAAGEADTGATGGTGTAKGGTGGSAGKSGAGGASGVSGAPATSGTCDEYSQHAVECSLLTQPIDCASLGKNPALGCYYGCYQAAPCGTLIDYDCNNTQNSVADCVSACDSFPCGDGSTVPSSFACDGEKDCSNGADEQGCAAAPAFHCGSGEVVAGIDRCDGVEDCTDGSDEKGGCPAVTCPRPTAPVPGAACGDAATTLKSCGLLPGGVTTGCLDRTEYSACNIECYAKASCSELTGFFCGNTSAGAPIQTCVDGCNALSDTFPCKTGTDTVPGGDICDGYPDCNDGSDEDNCTFKCTSGSPATVPENYTCDGEADCADGSDESGCKATCP